MNRTPTRRASEGLLVRDRPALRVVKVGGSLLDWPLFAKRLNAWLSEQPPACSVLIAGGGDFTDAVRQAQAVHNFDDETAHWMCVRSLSVTAHLLSQLVPNATAARSLIEVLTLAWSGTTPIVLDPADFLRHDEPQALGIPLPRDWTATTDSIAARLALLMNAAELVLLKSADPPQESSLATLAAAGYVDEHFPMAANGLRLVRVINLRGGRANEARFGSG